MLFFFVLVLFVRLRLIVCCCCFLFLFLLLISEVETKPFESPLGLDSRDVHRNRNRNSLTLISCRRRGRRCWSFVVCRLCFCHFIQFAISIKKLSSTNEYFGYNLKQNERFDSNSYWNWKSTVIFVTSAAVPLLFHFTIIVSLKCRCRSLPLPLPFLCG